MTTKIGKLGVTTNVNVGTTTVYTVPASKAAKVRIQWYIRAPNTARFEIKVNGVTIFGDTAGAAEISASAAPITDPEASVALALQATNPILATPPTHVLRPMGVDYYMATGDTVQLVKSVAGMTEVDVQVHGVEDDA